MTQEIESMMARGEWDQAIFACQTALQLQPANARLHGYLGLCLYRQKSFEQAANAFRKAVTLDEKFWEAGLKLAQCLDRLQRYEEALTVAREAHHIKPGDPTLNVLIQGLERHVTEAKTDGWQKSAGPVHHNVTLSQQD